MKVFLSWSGKRSKKTAEVLGDQLQQMIQVVEPWISTDISKGPNWVKEIGSRLEDINFGIICLTKENLEEHWILFEAGALSKKQGSHVCTFLLDLKHADIKPPLALYQHTIFDKEDIRKLFYMINNEALRSSESKLDNDKLDKIFDRYWPDLERELKKIVDMKPDMGRQIRSDREILEEILEIVRMQGQEIWKRTDALSDPSGNLATANPYDVATAKGRRLWPVEIEADDRVIISEVINLHRENVLNILNGLIQMVPPVNEEALIGVSGLDKKDIIILLEEMNVNRLISKSYGEEGTVYNITSFGKDYLYYLKI